MRSLNRQLVLSFYILTAVGVVATLIAFFNVSNVLGNYSLEEEWDHYLEAVLHFYSKNQNQYASAINSIIKEEVPKLFVRTEKRPFVDKKDLEALSASIATLAKDPSNENVFNTLETARDLLKTVSEKELGLLRFLIMLIVFFAFGVFVFLILIPQKRFVTFSSRISKELSTLEIRSVTKPKNYSYTEAKDLVDAFNSMVKKLSFYKLIMDITRHSKTVDELTGALYLELKKFVKFDGVFFAVFHDDVLVIESNFGDSTANGVAIGTVLKPPKELVESPQTLIANDLDADDGFGFLDPVRNAGVRSSLAFPVCQDGRCIGFLFLNSFEKESFRNDDVKMLDTISEFLTLGYQKTLMVRDLFISTVKGFTKLVEEKDNESGYHLVRMANYSKIIAQELSKNPKFSKTVTPNYINEIYEQAPLHDIGKVGIPDYILLKPGKLDKSETEIMEKHTLIGYEILERINEGSSVYGWKFFEMGANIARSHQEWWDGSGYPDKLRGRKIPVCARIVAVADVFDALTSERPYKKAFDYERSVRIITEGAGTHFDPEVVDAFVNARKEIRRIYEYYLESGVLDDNKGGSPV